MANRGEDILASLEFAFGELSIKNSVRTRDGKIVRLDKALQDDSLLLKKQLLTDNSLPTVVPLSHQQLHELLKVHSSGEFPTMLQDVCSLLKTSRVLQLQKFTIRCAKFLFERTSFFEVDYPKDWSTELVMLCFKALLKSPMRTSEIYKQELKRISDHCNRDNAVMTRALNSLRARIGEYSAINLEGIAVSFRKRTIPIAIYHRMGRWQTAIFDGTCFKSVELFGKNFSPTVYNVEESFYLKYGVYLLYKSGDCVCRKNLQDNGAPVVILDGCHKFLTRRDSLIVVQRTDEGYYFVLQWEDDDHFVPLYRAGSPIEFIDFECDERYLAIGDSPKSFLLFKLSNDNELILLQRKKIRGFINSVVLFKKRMFLIRRFPGNGSTCCSTTLETYDILKSSDSSGAKESLPLADPNIDLKRAGDDFFYSECSAVQITAGFPSLNEVRTVASEVECLILSELTMWS